MLFTQNGRDLPNHFAGVQIPLNTQQGSQTKLTIDGTPHLAGYTNGGAPPIATTATTVQIAAACLPVIARPHRFPVPDLFGFPAISRHEHLYSIADAK